MDLPCTYIDLRRCLRDLAHVNSMTRAYRPTLQWLKQFRGYAQYRPLHVVDVGSGGGDVLRPIERWAAREQIDRRLTGIDLNPHAVQAAREFTPSSSRIRWKTGNAHSFDHEAEPIELIISSLVRHHTDDREGPTGSDVAFGWFVNDLSRSRASDVAFQALAKLAQWHLFIRHDGPFSIRRAFVPEDWRQYTKTAGLEMRRVSVDRHWPGCLTVSRNKGQCALSCTQRTLDEVPMHGLA